MKTLYLGIIMGLSIVSLQAFATDDLSPSSSGPENRSQFSYINDESQSQFIVPAIVAIVSIVVGIAIYAGTRSLK